MYFGKQFAKMYFLQTVLDFFILSLITRIQFKLNPMGTSSKIPWFIYGDFLHLWKNTRDSGFCSVKCFRYDIADPL